jgi:hypothetical protein
VTLPATSGTTAIFGIATKLTTIQAGTAYLAFTATGTDVLTVTPDASGYLQVRRGNQFAAVIATSSVPLVVGIYYYVELKVTFHATAGSLELRVNAAPVATFTGNTGTPTWNGFHCGAYADFDDLYLLDGTGAAPWNDFLGDCRVDVRNPTAEGASSAWTPLSGTDNALMVDDPAPDDDTTYVSTTVIGATDTHVVQDAAVVGAPIRGVQVCLSMKKTGAGACTVAPVIRHSGTDYSGTAVSPASAYVYSLAVYSVNPGTGAAWTESDFNAAEFGYTRVT